MESGRDNAEVKGDVKEPTTAAVSATLKVEGNSTNIRGNDKQLDEEEDDMGKQNGEELDEDAQERMLSNESAAKITSNEKTATEVRNFSFFSCQNSLSLSLAIVDVSNRKALSPPQPLHAIPLRLPPITGSRQATREIALFTRSNTS